MDFLVKTIFAFLRYKVYINFFYNAEIVDKKLDSFLDLEFKIEKADDYMLHNKIFNILPEEEDTIKPEEHGENYFVLTEETRQAKIAFLSFLKSLKDFNCFKLKTRKIKNNEAEEPMLNNLGHEKFKLKKEISSKEVKDFFELDVENSLENKKIFTQFSFSKYGEKAEIFLIYKLYCDNLQGEKQNQPLLDRIQKFKSLYQYSDHLSWIQIIELIVLCRTFNRKNNSILLLKKINDLAGRFIKTYQDEKKDHKKNKGYIKISRNILVLSTLMLSETLFLRAQNILNENNMYSAVLHFKDLEFTTAKFFSKNKPCKHMSPPFFKEICNFLCMTIYYKIISLTNLGLGISDIRFFFRDASKLMLDYAKTLQEEYQTLNVKEKNKVICNHYKTKSKYEDVVKSLTHDVQNIIVYWENKSGHFVHNYKR